MDTVTDIYQFSYPETSDPFAMADKTSDQEPSIEEILASIRQIISDDDEKDDAAPATEEAEPDFAPVNLAPQPEPAFVPEPTPAFEPEPEEEEEDVLELNNPVVEDEPEEQSFDIDLQEPAPEPDPDPVPAPEPVYMPQPAPEAEVKMPPKSTLSDEILTEAARSATLSSMAKLAGNMPISRHRDYGTVTLEDLVREMLHPMLRDWLSENLPPMVERTVQKELEKLARQAQDV